MTYKDNLLVSIIIDNYNSCSFIKEAIDSALNQTYPNLEIIVVDDASTDGSQEVISSYGDRVTPIIKDKNEGQLSAYNTGFSKVKGDIIFVLDGDDLFYPDKVEKIVNIYKDSQDFSSLLVYHELHCIDRDDRVLGSKVPDPILHQVPTNIYQEVCDRNLISADFSFATSSGIAISRELAQSIFPLPENENLKARADSFVYTLAALLGKVYGIKQTLGAFRLHGNNYHQKHQKLSNERLMFVIALEKFLNQKLKENHKKPVVNLFGTIYDFYNYYYKQCVISSYSTKYYSDRLMELSLKTLKLHLGVKSIKLFIKTLLVYLLFILSDFLRLARILPMPKNLSVEDKTENKLDE